MSKRVKRQNVVNPEKEDTKDKMAFKLEFKPEKDNQPGFFCEVSGRRNCQCEFCK